MRGGRQSRSRLRLASGAVLAVVAALVLVFAPAGGLDMIPSTTPFVPPGFAHPLGTDDLGRDMLLAAAQGTRTSLTVGFGVTTIALALGFIVGLLAGFSTAWLDQGLMRFADIVASLPMFLIAVLVAALFGGSITNLILVMALTRWPIVARFVRVETASLRARDFVRAAEALGATPLRIALRHVLPNAATAPLASAGILFGGAMVSESALAFVGLGDPSVTSLGQLAANGFAFVLHAPWVWMTPVVIISVAAGLFAMTTDRAGPVD